MGSIIAALVGMAGNAVAQPIVPYDYVDGFQMNFGTNEYFTGLASWHDGTIMATKQRLSGDSIDIQFFRGNNTPLSTVTINGTAGVSVVTAEDICAAHPSLEQADQFSTFIQPTCFAVGTFVEGLADVDVEDDAGPVGVLACGSGPQLALHSWIVKADEDGIGAGSNNYNQPRTFCAQNASSGVRASSVAVIENGGANTIQCLVVAGDFFGGVNFGPNLPNGNAVTRTSVGTRDGFVVVLDSSDINTSGTGLQKNMPVFGRSVTYTEYVLQLGAAGQEVVINDIAAPALDSSRSILEEPRFVVTGSFTGTIDFDPNPTSAENRTSAGGTDLFVACYRIHNTGTQFGQPFDLEWVYVPTGPVGSEYVGDDAGLAVAYEYALAKQTQQPIGDVFVGGYIGDSTYHSGGVASGDGYLAGFLDPTPASFAPDWEHVFVDTFACDTKVNSIALDGVGRVLAAGQVGNPDVPDNDNHWVDLNPDPNRTNSVGSAGRHDMFFARYNPVTGSLDWADSFGTDEEDVAEAITVDQYNTSQIVYGGELDNGGPTPFAQTLDLQIEDASGLGIIGTIIIDPDKLDMAALADALNQPNVISDPDNPVQPRRAMNAINAYAFGFTTQAGSTAAPNGGGPVQTIPPTQMTSETLVLLQRKAARYEFPHTPSHLYPEAIRLAETIATSGVFGPTSPTSRKGHLLLAAGFSFPSCNYCPDPVVELVAARADLLATSQYDHIHGMFLDDREYPRDFVAASDSNFPDTWSTTGVLPVERHLGMAMGYGHLNVQESLVRMLQRIFHRPGDYDLDGTVEVTFTAQCNGSYSGTPSGDDWTKFFADSTSVNPPEYADWNFDTTYNGDEGPPGSLPPGFGVDFSKFITDVLGGCP